MADKELMRLSREEIARQFELPERQSKIATLLKQDGQAYCICRSSDSSRFMIGCDSCEEWYHGDCIGLTEKEAKYIRQFYCVRCQEEDSSLQTLFKPGVKPELEARFCTDYKSKRKRDKLADITSSAHVFAKPNTINRHGSSSSSSSKRSCGQCTNCFRTRDCGECRVCYSGRTKELCINRRCFKLQASYYLPEKEKKKQSTKNTSKTSNARRKRKDSDSDNERNAEPIRQCYGPGCINVVRPKSKYCSDTCGIQLATNRIYQVLPQRIQEWALSPCLAEDINKKELESVRRQQLEVRVILQELDKRHKELDAIIERAKHATVHAHADDDADEEIEMSMYCITCGHEIHSRTAIKHMEKCFNKYESQASFGSIYKTRIEGNNMFCDFYNPSNKTYCKRLRVLCPEHCKDPKVSDKEVCGCPLVTNVFNLTGEFCRASKKSCVKHYCWEKLRRAEIDMERVRQWLKIDELIEQERQIRQKMADRAGVLALMLHSTYNHDLMEQMTQNVSHGGRRKSRNRDHRHGNDDEER